MIEEYEPIDDELLYQVDITNILWRQGNEEYKFYADCNLGHLNNNSQVVCA